MLCRITDMHNKEVINIRDGMRLGCVDDVEVDTCTACMVAIILHGRPRIFGLAGRDEDMVIPWRDIEVIGEETILVSRPVPCFEPPVRKKRPGGGILGSIFGGL